MDSLATLRKVLLEVHSARDLTFSGAGVIVWDGISSLPIISMRTELPTSAGLLTSCKLRALSDMASVYHDGFHVVDTSMNLVVASAYFSPPIPPALDRPHPSVHHGARFFTALFGSRLPGVLCTGIVSPRYGLHLFLQGREV